MEIEDISRRAINKSSTMMNNPKSTKKLTAVEDLFLQWEKETRIEAKRLSTSMIEIEDECLEQLRN